MITRFILPFLLLAGGIVFLLFLKNAPRIRWSEANGGWLLLGLGALLLLWEAFKARRRGRVAGESEPPPPANPPEGHGRPS